MFIECSACNSKYLVNSADLKPNGRLVECATCSHQWHQEVSEKEKELDSAVPHSKYTEDATKNENMINQLKSNNINEIRNLPSTIVKEKNVSYLNSFLILILLFLIIFLFWVIKHYGINIFVLFNFYINEFYFNLKLIISDLGNIINKILN